jgi:hypothetical protein
MNKNWQYKISNCEAPPPVNAWSNIASTLDTVESVGTNFVTKLTAFEATPPATTQKNIFDLLDAETNASFEKKLYNFEAAAPANVWANIVTVLQKSVTKVIPCNTTGAVRTMRPVYYRVAAALVVIGLLSVGIFIFNKKKIEQVDIANVPTVTPKVTDSGANSVAANNTTAPLVTPQIQQVTTTQPAVKQKQVADASDAKVKPITPVYIQSNETENLAQNPANLPAEKIKNSKGETLEDINLVNASTNGYVTISGPDGQRVRLSNKLAAFAGYLDNKTPDAQENIELIIKESSKWRATFTKWRNKMINNGVAPSPVNFMDIVELSDVLEANK